jgi:hypothetical protein
MDFVDVKYINLISSRLQKFKKVKNNLYISVARFVETLRRTKTRQGDTFTQSRIIQTSSVITVGQVYPSITFLNN